jgi:hypothetical protein
MTKISIAQAWMVLGLTVVILTAAPVDSRADVVRIPDTSCEGKSEGDECTVNSPDAILQGEGTCIPDDSNNGRALRCLTEAEREWRESNEEWVMHHEAPDQGCGAANAPTAGSVVIGLILSITAVRARRRIGRDE